MFKKVCAGKMACTVLILIAMVSGIQSARFFRKARQEAVAQEEVPAKAKGNPSAGIHIIEYSDFQCPACTNASNTLKEVFERHSSKMYIEFRHYPLPTLHPYAILCAVYSECAAQQGKFWPYHDRLFDEREELSRSMRVQGRLIDIAQELGLEMAQFRKCVQDPAVELTVLDEKSKGSDLGVKATPSYFINGQIYVGSNSLKKELDRILGEEK